MSWNYRVVKQTVDLEKNDNKQLSTYSITSVYYDKNGKPNGYADPVNFPIKLNYFETLEELEGTLSLIRKALRKPIIDLDTF